MILKFKTIYANILKNDTPIFVDTMSQIWNIFNINTPLKHFRLSDEYSRPLVGEDWRFLFLHLDSNWLETVEIHQWKGWET